MIFPPRSTASGLGCPVRSARRRTGAALVIVLAFLVLAAVLVVAFLGTVANEHGAARQMADAEAGRQLAESTVQIVMGQIRTGTSRPGRAWASQPGLIRTYDDSGRQDEIFALYSTAQMVRRQAGAPFDPAVDLPDAGWAEKSAVWTDLNSPAEGRSGEPVFPVIDPRAAAEVSDGLPVVAGFSYDAGAVEGAAQPAEVSDPAARLPLPVRWIYVLRDGTLTVPRSGTGPNADFVAPEPVPTAENPVIGRIAFWTDDETCKLNVNTAAGGVPWDTPIGNSGLEMLFARYQPARNETSRYPGHPATVSLAPALWTHLGMGSPEESLIPKFTPNFNTAFPMTAEPVLSSAAAAFRDKVYPLVPRNTYGGSMLATRPTAQVRNGAAALAAVDSDRLFVSGDELLFGPNESDNERDANPLGLTPGDTERLKFFLTAHSRAPEVNLFNLPKVCLWPLPDAARKSVANANAVGSDTRSPLDRLIAFCCTLDYDNGQKKREYAFTRYDATSRENDGNATDAFGTANNQIVYAYLETLLNRPVPGFGDSFSARYGEAGARQILTGIYDFIRSQINLLDTSRSAADPADLKNLDAKFVSRYAYAANVSGSLGDAGLGGTAGMVVPSKMANGTRGGGRFPVVSQVAVEFIAQAANQPPVAGNPMHPFLPGGSPYPTFDMDSDTVAAAFDPARAGRFHTHPGMRFLTISGTGGPADFTVPNPRYRGPDLAEFQTQIEPAFLVAFSHPGAGVPGSDGAFKLRVRGLQNLRVNGQQIFASQDANVYTINGGNDVLQFHLGPRAGPDFRAQTPLVAVGAPTDFGRTFSFDGGSFEIDLLDAVHNTVVQTYKLAFPAATCPTPLLPHAMPADSKNGSGNSFWTSGAKIPFPPVSAAHLPPSSLLTFDRKSNLGAVPNFPAEFGYVSERCRRDAGTSASFVNMILPEWPVENGYRGKLSSDTVRSLEVAYGDARLLTQLETVPADLFLPHRFYFDTKMRAAHSLRDRQFETAFEQMHGATFQYLTASSAVPSANLPTYGGAWVPGAANPGNLWDVATGEDVQRMMYNYFVVRTGPTGNDAGWAASAARWPFTSSACEFDPAKFAAYKASSPALSGIPAFPDLWARGGDFSSGIPGIMDGPMLGKIDEGNNRVMTQGIYPYFNGLASTSIMPVGPNIFSPNRQVPSPVVLGSLPSGFLPSFDPAAPKLSDLVPWRTLLFSPNPVSATHDALAEVSRGGAVPPPDSAPDFALLDLFWMPVTEPYAISEPLSTAGKVNMNAQIAPFTYITRDTALRGVLRSTLLTAVPDKWINFKNTTGGSAAQLSDLGGNSSVIDYANFRYPIDAGETLKQFHERYQEGDLFRSASEICSLWLYPGKRSPGDASPPVWDDANAAIADWWYADPGKESKSVTGDNLREKPYATLYPLLTTKSNTFTVHYKVQTLQKVPGTPSGQWVEGRDRVTGEYQGSQTIERYVDPSDAKLPDFAVNAAESDPSVSDYYRFRVLSNKRFVP